MAIHESAENYLETILMLSKKRPVVRAVDIANELDFKKSSVSIAMKNLREANHITVTKEGYIYLTESGQKIAETIYERHQLLSSWLTTHISLFCLFIINSIISILNSLSTNLQHSFCKRFFRYRYKLTVIYFTFQLRSFAAINLHLFYPIGFRCNIELH